MKVSRLIIIGCFTTLAIAITTLISPLQAGPEETVLKIHNDENEFIVGVITISPPEEYVVIKETETDKRRLYKKDEYEKIKNKGMEILETVFLNTIEYRYKPVQGKIDFTSDQFELVGLKNKKAILKKEYAEKQEELIEKEEPPLAIEEMEEIEEVQKDTEEAAEKKTPPKRLVAELFFKIESKQISEHEWEITLPTILAAASNFKNVLGIVIEKINDLIEPEKKSKIYFKTSIGKGVLGPDGLLIESLNSRIKAKCGIKDDDLIQSVSTKHITTIEDVASVFSNFTGSPQTVTVKLTRDNTELTLTYYIK